MRVTPDCDSINTVTISQASGVQMWPEIAFGGGNYVVAWTDHRGTYYHTYAARVTPQGTVLDPSGIQVGPSSTQNQYQPSITFDGTRFFVVWGYAQSPYAVTGRFVETDGTLGDTVRIGISSSIVWNTKVASDGSDFLAVWMDYTPRSLWGQIIAGDGSLIGSPFLIASPVHISYQVDLCFDGINYLVTYSANPTGGYRIWGRKYDTSGNPVGDAFQICNTTRSCYYPGVVPGNDNYYLNVWSENSDIYGNVDIEIVGTEEQKKEVADDNNLGATIVRGPIHLPQGKQCRVLDITGREADPLHLAPGVYFIEMNGKATTKVIKLK